MEDSPPWMREEKVLKKQYRIRSTGKEKRSLETTIPREVFEREARRLGMNTEDAVKNLVAVWRYNDFPGLHLSFEKKKTVTFKKGLKKSTDPVEIGDPPVR